LILRHLSSAWDHAMSRDPANGALKDQKIILCVPASFDTPRANMTLEAARLAGFMDVTLLEEPQAAFYAWIAQSNGEWRKPSPCRRPGANRGHRRRHDRLQPDRRRRRSRIAGAPPHCGRRAHSPRRRNMDLALADSVATRLAREKINLDPWQLRGLALACCDAKERLLVPPVPQASACQYRPSRRSSQLRTAGVSPASS